MWGAVAKAFENRFRIVLFDHVGAGRSDLTAFDPGKYSSLAGYADDVIEIGRHLNLKNAVFVGHSVSAMIGVLASIREPDMFESLVLVGPSPRNVNDADYIGGFTQKDIEDLLQSLAETIWVGRRRWRRRSWAIRIVLNLGPS
jgi:sigma-B regulation protein RsbQ